MPGLSYVTPHSGASISEPTAENAETAEENEN